MIRKRMILPWENKFTLTCPLCGEKMQVRPLWNWEDPQDRISELQPFSCHVIDIALVKQIPVLKENDWKAKQKCDAYSKELAAALERIKPEEVSARLFNVRDGPPEIFLRHGIFGLMNFLTDTHLNVLYLLLSLEPRHGLWQVFFMKALRISRAHASTILKKLVSWRLIEIYRMKYPFLKGRVRSRQLTYVLSSQARERLDKDLCELDFFRGTVSKAVRPVALCFNKLSWRTDLGLLEREK